jgi:hypothetical protein
MTAVEEESCQKWMLKNDEGSDVFMETKPDLMYVSDIVQRRAKGRHCTG